MKRKRLMCRLVLSFALACALSCLMLHQGPAMADDAPAEEEQSETAGEEGSAPAKEAPQPSAEQPTPDAKDEPGLQREARGVRGGSGGIGEAQGSEATRASDGPPDPMDELAEEEAGASPDEPVREGRRSRRTRVKPGTKHEPGPSLELQLPAGVRSAVLANELHGRLSSVSQAQRFMGQAPGGGRWQREALGQGEAVPMLTHFSRTVLRTMTLRDGSRVWLASGHVNEPAAVLRLGDLLPLLSALGINDRSAALAVTEISFGGGAVPPAYTMTFSTGALWPHRGLLEAAERNGRVLYSLVSGRLTVLGGLVTANVEGDLRVRFVDTAGDDVHRYRELIMPSACAPLEKALRSESPKAARERALALLDEPSIAQACAARYLAVAAPEGAAARLRTLMTSGRVGQPGDVVEALVHLEPELSDVNLQAITRMVERTGAAGANGVCNRAPLLWSELVLEREELSEPNRRVLSRCLRR